MSNTVNPLFKEDDDRRISDTLNEFVYALYRLARGGPGPLGNLVLTDAAHIDEVLRAPDRFPKNFALLRALGDSRFSTNGGNWERRRDLTHATYMRAGAPANRGLVASVFADALADCDGTDPVSMQRTLMNATMRVFLQAFGRQAKLDPLLAVLGRARTCMKRLQYHSWFAPNARALADLRRDAELVLGDFGREMAALPGLADLERHLQSEGEDIESFVARDELLMNLLAGIETTAATLCFAIDRLGIDPRVQHRIFEEVDAAQCPYLECFLNETLRYFPPVPFITREAAADTTVGSIPYRKGQVILLSIVGVHQDHKFWKEPEIFDCSRAEFLHDSYDRKAFIPFATGPRMCGGARLARLELSEGFKAFVRRFRVEREGDDIKIDYAVALRPDSWDRVSISKRA